MNLLSLAWRNTVRSFPRRWPVVVILASAVAVLEVGNTLFESSAEGLERTYVRSFASDLTISAQSDEGFTIFGNELPLIGEYQVLPVLPDSQAWIDKVKAAGGRALGQVTAGGSLATGGWSKAGPVFGVDFRDYFSFFPDLMVVKGSLPRGEPGALVMNEAQYNEASQALGGPVALGTPFTLTVFNDHSFTIREVKLAAVYRYPVRDEVLDRIALVDPDTARALNGYIYGGVATSVPAQGTSGADLDALFDGPSDQTTNVGPGLTEGEVASRLADDSERKAQNTAVAGTWNFVLTHGLTLVDHDGSVQVRGWRDTAGGNALVVWLLQVLFNAGLAFITLAAALVGINGLALSVAERTQELGTLRALGATRARVAGLVTVEALVLVAGAGLVGVGIGVGLVAWVGYHGFPVVNPYLQALFGTERLHPNVSITQVFLTCGFSLALGLAAVVVPVRRALGVTPVAAMAKG